MLQQAEIYKDVLPDETKWKRLLTEEAGHDWSQPSTGPPTLLSISVSGIASILLRDQALGMGRLALMMRTPTRDGYRGSSSPCRLGFSQPT